MLRRKNHRLDRLVDLLLRKSRNDLHRRARKLLKDPPTARDHHIRELHKEGSLIDVNDVIMLDEGKWRVKSQETPAISYNVSLVEMCFVPRCLRCRTCELCTHMVTCSCLFYQRGELCKHIHACGIHFRDLIRTVFPKRGNDLIIKELKSLDVLAECDVPKELAELRSRVTGILISNSKSLNSEAEIAYLKDICKINSPRTTTAALESPSRQGQNTPKTSRPPPNQLITPQRKGRRFAKARRVLM